MKKSLYRSRTKKVIAGIAGGFGTYLDIDPVIIRVLMIIFTLFHGIGILIYIILWIVIPEESFEVEYNNNYSEENNKTSYNEETAGSPDINKNTSSDGNGRVIFGSILILLGMLFLLEKFIPSFDFDFIFSVGIIGLGIYLVYNSFKKSENKNESV